VSAAAPATGIAAFDATRWVNPPPRTRGVALASGAKLALILPGPPAALSWEADSPPAADHLVIWRHGARAPVEARIADRRDPASPRLRRNGFLVPAGAASRWVGREMVPSLSLHLHLPPAWLARLAAESGLPDHAAAVAPMLGLPERRLAPILGGLLSHLREEDEPPLCALEHWVLLAGCALLPRPRAGRRATLDAAALGRVLDFLHASLHRDVGLAEMAAIPDMPERAFAAAFRAATGETPHRHLARLRLARARELLSASGLPTEDVALLSGFRSAAQLRAALRRQSARARGPDAA